MSPGEERRKQGVVFTRIRGLARRLNTAIVLSSLVGPVWAVVAGIALWRFAVQRWVPAAAVLLVAGGAAAAWIVARRKLVTQRQAAVMVDRQAHAGGLLLTRLETGIGDWEPSLQALVGGLVPPRVDIARPLAAIALALSFLVAALFIPLPAPLVRPLHAAAASRVDELTQKLEAAAKEEPIEAEVRKELERLREEVKQGDFDPADWEAADSLAKELERKAEEAGAKLLKTDEAAQELAVAMDDARTLEVLTRERDELERALMELSNGAAESADQALQQALERGSPPAAPLGDSKRAEPERGSEGERGRSDPQEKGDPQARHGAAGEPKPGPTPEARHEQQRRTERQGGAQANGRPQGASPATDPSAAAASPNGQPGEPHKGGQGPTRAELDELRRALQQRREQLAKAFGQGADERRSSTASRSRRPPQKGNGPASKAKGGTKGESLRGGEEGTAGGEEEAMNGGKATRVVGETSREHASRLMTGAPTHGPAADTDLVFAGRAEMDPTRLTMKPMPEGNGGEGTELLGLVAADPTRRGGGKVTPGSGRAAAGEEAPANREGSYLPRNKAVIQRYFDSTK